MTDVEVRTLKGGVWQRAGHVLDLAHQTVSRPELPFDPPSRAAWATSPFKVWPHYMGQFPIKQDNVVASAPDYYTKLWMPPGGIETYTDKNGVVHTTDWGLWGGWLRDRPLDRAPSAKTQNVNVGPPGITTNTPRWNIDDKLTEIKYAYDAGFDGFALDMTSNSAFNDNAFKQTQEMLYAVNEFGDSTFKILIQPDGSTGSTTTYQQLAKDCAYYASLPVTYKLPTGQMLIAAYGGEFVPSNGAVTTATKAGAPDPNFWPNFKNLMESSTYKVPTSLWFVFSTDWLTNTLSLNATTGKAYSYGYGRWGMRNPVDNRGTGNSARGAAAYCETTFGKPWFVPVSKGDERPKGLKFNECRNSENLRVTWQAAIEQRDIGAPMVIIPTWNDYGEGAHIAVTQNQGFCILDISTYYMTKYKLNYYPEIKRACIYLSHRTQFVNGTTYTADSSRYTTKMSLIGGTAAVDQVEALVFLPEPANVTITAGGKDTTTLCPAGVTPVTAPLQFGTISAKAVTPDGRTIAQITSPWAVSNVNVVQDMQYKYVSSLRGA